jgi:hypothetical protein
MREKLLLVGLALSLTGCATMMLGTSRPIQFESTPPGATVTFQDKQCKTPCEFTAERSDLGRHGMLKIDLDGHESYWTELTLAELTVGEAPGVAAGSILGAFLIIPGIIDLSSGALYRWPAKVSVVLPEKGRGSALAQITR